MKEEEVKLLEYDSKMHIEFFCFSYLENSNNTLKSSKTSIECSPTECLRLSEKISEDLQERLRSSIRRNDNLKIIVARTNHTQAYSGVEFQKTPQYISLRVNFRMHDCLCECNCKSVKICS